MPGGNSKEGIVRGWYESQAALKVDRVCSLFHLNRTGPTEQINRSGHISYMSLTREFPSPIQWKAFRSFI